MLKSKYTTYAFSAQHFGFNIIIQLSLDDVVAIAIWAGFFVT
jgi:hypothetical protein